MIARRSGSGRARVRSASSVSTQIAGQWLSAADLIDALAALLGVQARAKEPHRASSLVRDPLRLAQLLGKIEREGSAVVTVHSRMGHDHTRLWSLVPKVTEGDGGGGGVDPGFTVSKTEEEDLQSYESDSPNTPPTPPSPPTTGLH